MIPPVACIPFKISNLQRRRTANKDGHSAIGAELFPVWLRSVFDPDLSRIWREEPELNRVEHAVRSSRSSRAIRKNPLSVLPQSIAAMTHSRPVTNCELHLSRTWTRKGHPLPTSSLAASAHRNPQDYCVRIHPLASFECHP